MLIFLKFGEKMIYLKNNIIELFQANKESLFASEIDYFEKAIKSNNISFQKFIEDDQHQIFFKINAIEGYNQKENFLFDAKIFSDHNIFLHEFSNKAWFHKKVKAFHVESLEFVFDFERVENISTKNLNIILKELNDNVNYIKENFINELIFLSKFLINKEVNIWFNISFNKYSKSIFIGNKSGNLAIIELPKSNNKKIKINVQFKENNKIFKGFNSLKNDKFKLIYSKYSRD